MSWSLGEARSLGVKAARGSGMSWGVAEEVGFALDWLQSSGAPGIEALAALLDAREGSATDNTVCPFYLGTALADGARAIPDQAFSAEQPLLLIPFLAIAKYDQPMSICWEDVDLSFSEAGIDVKGLSQNLLQEKAICSLREVSEVINPSPEIRVPDTARDAMKRLSHHAHKTYAPATEQSRQAGAGAGLTDND